MANKEDIESWITVKGNHIPILKGQSKEDAIKSFLAEKEKTGKATQKKKVQETFKTQKSYKGEQLELKRNPDKADSVEKVNVKKYAQALQKKIDKIFGAGEAMVFAHGSGKMFSQLSDLYGYSGEGAQVHGAGVYSLVEAWELSKGYAQKAFRAAIEQIDVASPYSRDFIGYSNEEIEDIADKLEDMMLNRSSTGFKSTNPDENRWSLATAVSADIGKNGPKETRAMQNFLATMYANDFKNYDEFKTGLKRTIKDIQETRDRTAEKIKNIKPQIMLGIVPPETKKRLFVVGSYGSEQAILRNQSDEVKDGVKRLINAIPPTEYKTYKIDGKQYLYTPDSLFARVQQWSEKSQHFVIIPKAEQESLVAKIKEIGEPNSTQIQKFTKYNEELTYEDIVKFIKQNWGGDARVVSKKFAEYGIFGIKYHGSVDKECVLQFDPSKFDNIARNIDGKWRDVSRGMLKADKDDLRNSQPYGLFKANVGALTNDIQRYGLKNLKVDTSEPEVLINDKGGMSSYVNFEYTKSDGDVIRFRMRVSDHARHRPDKDIQIYQNIDWHINGRSLEQKLKDKIKQIESLPKGAKLPIEKNTTSDEKDTK